MNTFSSLSWQHFLDHWEIEVQFPPEQTTRLYGFQAHLEEVLIYTWWERERGEREGAKAAKTHKSRFTSSRLDVTWQSSILVNKWWVPGTETQKRSKTLINYLYLFNETTLIYVSRSGRTQADLSSAFNVVGISLITRGMGSRFSLHSKAHCAPDSFIMTTVRTLYSRPGGKTINAGQNPWKLHVSQQTWRKIIRQMQLVRHLSEDHTSKAGFCLWADTKHQQW